MSGSPDGRSLSVSGQSSIQSQPGTSALACAGRLVTGARSGAEPVTSGSQVSASSASRLIGAGSAEAVVTARNVPSVRHREQHVAAAGPGRAACRSRT